MVNLHRKLNKYIFNVDKVLGLSKTKNRQKSSKTKTKLSYPIVFLPILDVSPNSYYGKY